MFMKSKSFIALAAAGILAATAGVSQIMPAAEAQSSANAPVILIVDQARLIGLSKAGESIASQMETLQSSANSELETTVNELVKSAEELQGKQDSMTEEAFTEEARKLAVRRQNIPVLREVKVRELNLAEQKAISQINEAAGPILEAIVNERGATLLLERGEVLYAAKSTDITDEALKRLDAKLTTVKVEKIDLQEAARQAQAAQQAQQQ